MMSSKIVWVLLFLALVAWFTPAAEDTDMWWHLKTGAYVLEQKALPSPDPFSYTTQSAGEAYAGEARVRQFNLTHEWLAQAGMALLHRAGGFPALVLLRALLLAGCALFAGLAAWKRTGMEGWGWAGAAICASNLILFTADRPALLTFFFVAFMMWVLEDGRWEWALPGLALIWANCHGGYFLAWVIAAIYLVDRRTKKMALLAAAVVAASMVNPNGLAIVPVLRDYRNSPMTKRLIEWFSPPVWGPPYAFQLTFALTLAALLAGWKRSAWRDRLLFAAFGTLAWMAFRNVALFGATAPMVMAAAWPWKFTLDKRVVAGLAVIAAGVAIWQGRAFGFRTETATLPEGAVRFVMEKRTAGPLFNLYGHGGYLIWRMGPERKTFVDGRALSERVFEEYSFVMGGVGPGSEAKRKELLEKYAIKTMILNGFQPDGSVYPMMFSLASGTLAGWKMTYEDASGMVWVKDGGATEAEGIWRHLENECELLAGHGMEGRECGRSLGFLFARTGDPERARKWLGWYLEKAGTGDAEASRAMAGLLRTR
jgi:hypothetical protein